MSSGNLCRRADHNVWSGPYAVLYGPGLIGDDTFLGVRQRGIHGSEITYWVTRSHLWHVRWDDEWVRAVALVVENRPGVVQASRDAD